jgi:RNA-directed DNA polymerase
MHCTGRPRPDLGRRFHALYERASSQVRRNNCGPGIVQITLAEVEQYWVSRLLDELEPELRAKPFRPIPAGGIHSQGPKSRRRCRFPQSVTESCRLW